VMPMGGLMNVDRTGDPLVPGIVAVGDAFCHTDPAFAWGLSFSLAHAHALARATAEAQGADAVAGAARPAPRRAAGKGGVSYGVGPAEAASVA
jgi:flavin-dependent dehydrogenase